MESLLVIKIGGNIIDDDENFLHSWKNLRLFQVRKYLFMEEEN
jgi:acetylglutamate kinase